MKRPLLTLLLLLGALLPAAAQETAAAAATSAEVQPAKDWTKRIHPIPEVTILGRRPIKEIGVQQTRFDSVVLKENIALSMADVLTFNSSIFVKSYGRATLSTVAFRGTSASHTQVTWNGMRINNPMLGMTDFSMIPSYFIDDASLLHGTSSVNETGGGLGGSVKLSTKPADARGFGLQYIQGIGSFGTFDEFLRLTCGNERWQSSTRVVCSSSPNDYRYRNRDKKENIYDDEHRIIGQYYPTERNRNASYRDLHLLQELYCNTGRGDRFGLNAWYIDSNRDLAMLSTSYADDQQFENTQREQTFRGIFSWDRLRDSWKLGAKAGYIHSWMAYDYKNDLGNGTMAVMTRSRSTVNTFYGQFESEYCIGSRWLFTGTLSAHQHLVRSADKNIIRQDGNAAIVGYDQGRIELSGAFSAKWRPVDRFGLSLVLREELYGTAWSPVIPALFVDGVLSERGNIVAKASVSRNYRFPTLNDLYFLPGGNPDLRKERGWTYDAGLSFAVGQSERYRLTGSATWFDSHIDDWILWLWTVKGFLSPVNIKAVHSYGVELHANLAAALSEEWRLETDATYSWTPSLNVGEPITAADRSLGKQLPYIPEHSATFTGQLSWRTWSLLYKWCYYSKRYTLTNNANTLTGGRLLPYYMSNATLEKRFALRWADLSLKGSVNNLLNEEYVSVLSRPMPRINFEFFVGIRPKWGKEKAKQTQPHTR